MHSLVLDGHSLSLAQIDASRHFEIVIISDSTNADAWISESLAVDQLRRDLRETMPVWYRRRWHNTGRKAGNVEDFVKRWGSRYDYMVVLDADSIMAPQTLVALVARMQEASIADGPESYQEADQAPDQEPDQEMESSCDPPEREH